MQNTCRIISVFTLVIAGSLSSASTQAGFVVKDGKPVAGIYLPADPVGQPLQVAADELKNHILKMSGAELSILKGDAISGTESRIVLEVCPGTYNWYDGSDQSFTIEEKDNEILISGNSELATLYGAYQYLGELGIRWYEPGEIGENIPERKTIPIGKRKRDYTPAFVTRTPEMSSIPLDRIDKKGEIVDVGHFGTSKQNLQDYIVWRLRNRLHFDRNIKGGSFNFNYRRISADHSLRRMALKDANIANEPERYPLVTGPDGKQTRRDKAAQICFSNEKNVQTAIESCLQYFRDKPDLMTAPMALADCGGICECENCQKVGGNPPYDKERLVLTYMNKVAKAVWEKMPGRGIGIFYPYFELQMTPPGMKIEPNIFCVACRGATWDAAEENKPFLPFTKEYSEKLDTTQAAGASMAFYDYALWHCPQPLSFLDALEKYRKLGFLHCANEIMNRNEQLNPLLWVTAQYLWDGTGNPREMLKTFCSEYYGAKAGPDVFAIQEKIDMNSRNAYHIIYGGLNDCNIMMPEAFTAEGLAVLNRDIAAATGKEKIRLERFRDTFDMFGRMAQIYRAYCRALNERTPELVTAFETACVDFGKYWNEKNMTDTCGHSTQILVNKIGKTKIGHQSSPKGRKELDDKTVWKRELFAGEKVVPAEVPNLFPLPEIWKFRLDFEDRGLKDGWEKPGYDDSKGWQPLSTWNCYEEQGYPKVDGRFWYRLSFDAPKFPEGKKIKMRVGSLDDNGEVYVNGKLASKPNPYPADMWDKSYEFDVTKFIKPGDRNVIAVRGYDSFGAGGIWRPCAFYTE